MNICLLIAFVPQIARLVTKWVKEPEPSEEESSPRLRFISSSMVDIGELNIPEAEKATLELAGITKEMFEGYLAVFNDPNTDLSAEVKRLKALEDDADVLTHDITDYLVRTSAANLSAENARSVGRMLRIVSELEEVSDAIFRLIQITSQKYSKNRDLQEEATNKVREFADQIVQLIDLYTEVLSEGATEECLQKAEELEKQTDRLRKQHNKEAMKRMSLDNSTVKTEMVVIDMNNQFELIANYGLNVVQTAFYLENEDEVPDKYDS